MVRLAVAREPSSEMARRNAPSSRQTQCLSNDMNLNTAARHLTKALTEPAVGAGILATNHATDATRRKAAMADITLEQAQAVLDAALRKSRELGLAMDIALVDSGANLKAFARMDNAWLGSIDIAIRKARTARFFDMNTGELGKLSQPGGPLFNIEHSNGGLITFPGGVPLRDPSGQIIGAIGVSGSTVENDHQVAQAGAKVAQ